MSPKLLALPVEIKDKIIEELIPFSCEPWRFPGDVRHLAEDLHSAFENVRHVHLLARASPTMRQFFDTKMFGAFELNANDQRAILQDLVKTPVQMVADQARDGLGHPNYLARLFVHFRCITTLDLQNFRLSLGNLATLQYLKGLQTLSVQEPQPSQDDISNIHRLVRECQMPPARNLNINFGGIDDVEPLSCVCKSFERSIEMLSIIGNDYSDMFDADFLGFIMSEERVGGIKMTSLKHFHMDFLSSSAHSLREAISYSKTIESLSVDCRGFHGFLPVAYVIDLIRFATSEDLDDSLLQAYERSRPEYEVLLQQICSNATWKARLSRFFCKIKTVESEMGERRMVDTLELYFARVDENVEPINNDIRLSDMLDVFRARHSTFRELKTLVLATETSDPLNSAETSVQLRRTTETLCRNILPRVGRVTVRWGSIEQFSWTSAGQVVNSEEMDVDALWSWDP